MHQEQISFPKFWLMTSIPNEHKSFKLIEQRQFPAYETIIYLYKCSYSGASVIYVNNPKDKQNYFATSVHTPVYDDSGISSLVRRMCLNGSKKYPYQRINKLIEPFSGFQHLAGDIDYNATNFQFTSRNKRDFYQVADIILDGIFNPLFTSESFENVCHSVQFEDSDPKKPLIYTGESFNESYLKFKDTNSYMMHEVYKEMMPDSNYKFSLHGNPEEMLNLTLKDVKSYHQRHYQTSNMLFFQFGSFSITDTLEIISNYVRPTSYNMSIESFKQKFWTEPKEVEITVPANDPKTCPYTQYSYVNSWYTHNVIDFTTIHVLQILMLILLDGDDAPLHIELENIGFKQKMTYTLIPTRLCHCIIIEMTDMKRKEAIKLKSKINGILERISHDGFDQERIQTYLSMYELGAKKRSSVVGQDLFYRIHLSWQYNGDLSQIPNFDAIMTNIHRSIKENPKFFEEQLNKYLIQNPHNVKFLVNPDNELVELFDKRMKINLEKRKSKMSEQDIQDLLKRMNQLHELYLHDLPLNSIKISSKEDHIDNYELVKEAKIHKNVKLYIKPLDDISYVTFKVEMPLCHKYYMYLPLLLQYLTICGTKGMRRNEFRKRLAATTPHISFNYDIQSNSDQNDPLIQIIFSFSSLNKNVEKTLSLLDQLLLSPDLDDVSLLKPILNKLTDVMSINNEEMLTYYMSGDISEVAAAMDSLRGVKLFNFYIGLMESGEFSKALSCIQCLYYDWFLHGIFSAILHCSWEHDSNLKKISSLVEKLNSRSKISQENIKISHLYTIQRSVYFKSRYEESVVIVTFPIPHISNPKSSIYDVLATYIDNITFDKYPIEYQKLSSCSIKTEFAPKAGYLSFVMIYQGDGNLVLSWCRQILDSIAKGEIIEDDLNKAILQTLMIIDSARAPHEYGLKYFEISPENVFLEKRDQIIHVTRDQIIEEAKALQHSEWRIGIRSSQAITPIPKGFTILSTSYKIVPFKTRLYDIFHKNASFLMVLLFIWFLRYAKEIVERHWPF